MTTLKKLDGKIYVGIYAGSRKYKLPHTNTSITGNAVSKVLVYSAES